MLQIEAHGIRFNSIIHLLEIYPCCIGAENLSQNMLQAFQLAPVKSRRSSKLTGYFGRGIFPVLKIQNITQQYHRYKYDVQRNSNAVWQAQF